MVPLCLLSPQVVPIAEEQAFQILKPYLCQHRITLVGLIQIYLSQSGLCSSQFLTVFTATADHIQESVNSPFQTSGPFSICLICTVCAAFSTVTTSFLFTVKVTVVLLKNICFLIQSNLDPYFVKQCCPESKGQPLWEQNLNYFHQAPHSDHCVETMSTNFGTGTAYEIT